MLMMAAIKVHVDIIANTTFLSINPQELKPYHSYSPLLCWGHKAARLSISAEWSSSTTRRNDKLQIFVTKAEEVEEDGGRFSVWDSNAENVRMSRSGRSMRRTYPLPPPSFTNPKQRPVNEWDYEAQDGRYARKGGYMGQWNLSGDDDNFDSEEGEEDAEEDQGDFWPSTLNLDIRAVVGFVGLVFPAMLMTVPWLFNNPLGLMVALAFLPAASKFLAPVVWAQKSLSQLLGYFNSKPKKKRSTVKSKRSGQSNSARQTRSARLSPERDFWLDSQGLVDELQTFDANDKAKETQNLSEPDLMLGSMQNSDKESVSAGNEAGKRSMLGGWDDLEPIKREILTTPVRRKESLGRRSRKERPMYLRILVALFPFLRYWGGFL